jgi:hypothetical protein
VILMADRGNIAVRFVHRAIPPLVRGHASRFAGPAALSSAEGGTRKEFAKGSPRLDTVIAVGRGFSGGHESCCPKLPSRGTVLPQSSSEGGGSQIAGMSNLFLALGASKFTDVAAASPESGLFGTNPFCS